jgi:hypothetical protein
LRSELSGCKALRQRISRRKQKRKQARLAAGRVGATGPVLHAEQRAVQRDRDVSVAAAAEPGHERKSGKRDAEPEHRRKRPRSDERRRLESRKSSPEGPQRSVLPPVLHVRKPEKAC